MRVVQKVSSIQIHKTFVVFAATYLAAQEASIDTKTQIVPQFVCNYLLQSTLQLKGPPTNGRKL